MRRPRQSSCSCRSPAVRDAALATSRIDKYSGPDGTYQIRSLYLDTERYDLYGANQREQGDRFKARIRIYPGKPNPVFFEIERRVFDVIVKSRAAVSMNVWRDVLACKESVLEALPPNVRKGVTKFLGPHHRHHLAPKMLVEYEREASAGAYLQVSFVPTAFELQPFAQVVFWGVPFTHL